VKGFVRSFVSLIISELIEDKYMSDSLLEINNLSTGIKCNKNYLTFISDLSVCIKKGEIYGIVGESGCGKSMLAYSITGLLPDSIKILEGNIIFNGVDLLQLKKNEFRNILGKDISMVFQEPLTSLNPLMKIGSQVSENLKLHTDFSKNEIHQETLNILRKVNLSNPEKLINYYPHQLSGGMRQRAMIAMAIVLRPQLFIADEPTTALDATIQAQILDLMLDINRTYGSTIIFISHDLGVINRICNRVAVMYAGSIVEEGDTKNVLLNPQHEYTKGLIASIPTKEKKGHRLLSIPGKVPDVGGKSAGCIFANRCNKATEKCWLVKPQSTLFNHNHKVSCICSQNGGGPI
jgi:peptide/nickel transport system ATP-binding protein